jgi:hypothetical protein
MLHVTGARLRPLLAAMAGTFLLLLGVASGAHAATIAELQQVDEGGPVSLTDGITLTADSVTESGGKLEISNATVRYGDVGVGEGVSGTASGGELTLTGGSFDFDDRVVSGTFTIDNEDPLVFPLGSSGDPSGKLVPVTTEAPAALRTFSGISKDDADAAAVGLLPKTPQDNGPTFYEITLGTGSGSVVANLWQRVRQPDNSVVTTGRVLVNVTLTNRRYRVEVINWQFNFRGSTTVLNAVVAGNDILNPFEFEGVSGSLTGEVELTKGVYFTGGSLKWDKSGFSLSGGARVACEQGSISAGLSGTIVDNNDWEFTVNGQTNNGCEVSKDLSLPTGSLDGKISSVDGDVTGLLKVRGSIQTTLLPAGFGTWDAGFSFIYDGTDAGSRIEFDASAGIGTVEGTVRFDGTFALDAGFSVPFGNSNVAFDGAIKRETPGGPVVYDVGGSANLAFDKGSFSGSARLTNTQLSVSGSVTLACPVSGSITGAISTSLPVNGGRDWSAGISGGTSQGCQVTKEFGLGAGTGVSGELKSVNGVVSLAANANATVNTTLIPTKTSFAVGFAFAASQGAYSVALSGSTQGASFSTTVASNGTFNLAFSLDDLALGGVSLGAKGNVRRDVPGGAVAYSISGSLKGEAKIYDNLYFMGGSLSISNTGGLSFSGTVRQACTAGFLQATASGTIRDSRNWSFTANGQGSDCRIGKGARFDGRTFFANLASNNGAVTYDAGASISQLNLVRTYLFPVGDTSTWLTAGTARITNTCGGCRDRGVTQLSFSGRAHIAFRYTSKVSYVVNETVRVATGWSRWFGTIFRTVTRSVTKTTDVLTTKCVAGTGFGTVEISRGEVRRVSVGVRDMQFGVLPLDWVGALTVRVEGDLIQAFTGVAAGVMGSGGGGGSTLPIAPLGSGGPVSGWGC